MPRYDQHLQHLVVSHSQLTNQRSRSDTQTDRYTNISVMQDLVADRNLIGTATVMICLMTNSSDLDIRHGGPLFGF